MENQNQTSTPANGLAVMQPTGVGVNILDPRQFDIMQRCSQMFAASALVPPVYQEGGEVAKDKAKVTRQQAIANCMIALDVATRIGASPLMVMQNLVIVHNRPSWSSSFLIATVNTCGRFEPLKFHFNYEKGNVGNVEVSDGKYTKTFDGTHLREIECYAWTTAKGSDERLEGSTISLTMAIKEGWYDKPGSKWRTMPEQMLRYRAAAFWIRVYAPELSLGMQTTEEIQDVAFVEVRDAQTQVAQEKKENANQVEIGMDDDPQDGGQEQAPETPTNQPQEVVDEETGEVIDLQPEGQTPANAPNLPRNDAKTQSGATTQPSAENATTGKREPKY